MYREGNRVERMIGATEDQARYRHAYNQLARSLLDAFHIAAIRRCLSRRARGHASFDLRLALIWSLTLRILLKYLREEPFQIVPLKRLLQGWTILMRCAQTLFSVAG